MADEEQGLGEEQGLTAAVLPLAPQAEPVEWWHAYGPDGDGEFFVHGPSAADPDLASTLGAIVGLDYRQSFDHAPADDELAALP